MTHRIDISDLPAELWKLLRQIPEGRVTTYGDLADALGDIAAARWVGEVLLHHEHGETCPCHRVIRRTGDVGLYLTGDANEKIVRLASEGIEFTDSRIDGKGFRFTDFEGDRPLAKLAELQRELPSQFRAESLPENPPTVGAVDVSYDGNEAVAAFVIVETAAGNLLGSFTVREPVRFPYIPGYLSFRELPALLAVLDFLPPDIAIPEVVFVDGNGILHHRGAGIATHFGIITGLRTIGVGKKLLCGSVDLDALQAGKFQPVTLNGQIIGAALKAGPNSRPIFVSPGHRIMVDDAVRLTQRLFHGHRLPEPIYHADRLSRAATK